MELGGNKNAKTYYEKNDMMVQGQPPDHKNPALTRYKNDLKMRAEQACGGMVSEPKKEMQQDAPRSNIIITGGLSTQQKPIEE